MLSKKVEELCNRQIEREGFSSNLYLAMASWAENKGMAGIAAWLFAQADEERGHMLRFIKFLSERGGTAVIPAFKQPPLKFKGINEMFKEVLKHEQFITASISEVLEAAMADRDHATANWIQWFVKEQVEEECSVQIIIDKLAMAGDAGIYFLDRDIMAMRG